MYWPQVISLQLKLTEIINWFLATSMHCVLFATQKNKALNNFLTTDEVKDG